MGKKGLTALLSMMFLFGFSLPAMSAEPAAITIFAAASTTDALTEICNLFSEKQLGKVTPSFASSSTLAKQIENGAPADLFLSADTKWMDYLVEKKMVDPADQIELLGNRIVLIAPKDSSITKVDVKAGFAISDLLGENRLAMGDPEHVPAGIYGKEAFEKLGVWDGIKDKISPEKDVRAALVRVERGEVPLGVVYATDAAISGNVRVVGTFPEDTHAPIIYPAATVTGHKSENSRAFLEFLKGPDGRKIFEKFGFFVK
jgi:molybdate transport system substrate-binding protein